MARCAGPAKVRSSDCPDRRLGVCFNEFDRKDRGAAAQPTAYLWVNQSNQPQDRADAAHSFNLSLDRAANRGT